MFRIQKGAEIQHKIGERERERNGAQRDRRSDGGATTNKEPSVSSWAPSLGAAFPDKTSITDSSRSGGPCKKDADTARGTAAHSAVAPEFGGRAVTALRASGRVALDWLPPAF